MKFVLKVSSSNEYCDGDCEFAVVELSPELASLGLRRIAALKEQKRLDPDIDEVYYWANYAQFFSPWINLASTEKEVEAASLALADTLDDLQIQEKDIAIVSESFQVPPSQISRVECERMIVRADSIAFVAIPKHASFYVETVEIPLAVLERAAAGGVPSARG